MQKSIAQPLIVYAGGNNARIGNMLESYIELRAFSKEIGRNLIFPFAEQAIASVFDYKDPGLPSGNTAVTQRLYGRLLRTAEEQVEEIERVEAYAYSPDKIHRVYFEHIGLEVAFGRGKIDWKSEVTNGLFDVDRPLLLRDPFPFKLSNRESGENLKQAIQFLCLRPAACGLRPAACGLRCWMP
jgi:hypothetical protein